MIDSVFRKDFPFFKKNKISFLDTAASSQKPKCVIDAIYKIYSEEYANIHRGSYTISDDLTKKFEKTRSIVAEFINAELSSEIVFTKNATESVNLVAFSYGDKFINNNHDIYISNLEHHSNIVPWQKLCDRKGCKIKYFSVKDLENLEFSNNTALVVCSYMSNVNGMIVEVDKIVEKAKKVGAKVLIDACQAAAHVNICVKTIGCDFLVFSSHKIYGPCGVGVLYGKYSVLDSMDPYQTGGEVVQSVSKYSSEFNLPPIKFEAGTPAIVEIIAFGVAINYIKGFDCDLIRSHELDIFCYLYDGIKSVDNFSILEYEELYSNKKSAIVSFFHNKGHCTDVGDILNRCSVCVRAGSLCAQPFINSLGFDSTVRASIGMYTNKRDVDMLIEGMNKVNKIFK